MGTSQSSNGPGSGVPLIPPWAEDFDFTDWADEQRPLADDGTIDTEVPRLLAPPARFRDARRALGGFVRTGDNRDLRRALGHYVRTGYGGGATMTRRLGSTAATADRLNGILQSGRAPDGTDLRDAVLASGNDVNAILDVIVEAASPGDGTQDQESARRAVRDALSDLLARFPDADLIALTEPQRAFVIERYVALAVYGRFCLDLQKTVLDKAPDPKTGLRRLKYVREFIAEQVAAAFRAIRERNGSATTADVARLNREALRETLSVFEEYMT